MPFFENLKRGSEVTYFFLPEIYQSGLEYFLKQETVTGWNIVPKRDIIPHLPEGFQIPDVRLTDTAPRIEKRVICFVSRYTKDSVYDAYCKLIYSKAWLNWHNDNAAKAMAEYDFENAMANDPGPLDVFRPD